MTTNLSMSTLAAADRVELLVLVDNVTDCLSSTARGVEGELSRFWTRGARLQGPLMCCAAHGFACAITVTLYLGGWSLPGFHPESILGVAFSILVFAAKTALLVWVFIWVRWTLPRFRYDQLMRLGWKVLLPLALVNLFWAAGLEMVRAAR